MHTIAKRSPCDPKPIIVTDVYTSPNTIVLQPARRVCPWCLLADGSCGVPTLRDALAHTDAPHRIHADDTPVAPTARDLWDAEVDAIVARIETSMRTASETLAKDLA